ncbi:MAG: indolepyruvate ferredoxin oxidoreductase subunit alpha [Candidatus Caldarchaeum sp.]
MSRKASIAGEAGFVDFLMGNEAIARGAYEAGVSVATGYPGTPSSEIIDSLLEVADEAGIYVEWSVNEKVAMEIAMAASYCWARALCTMKHVGLNVAHDALMNACYMGARGGFVVVSADDPGAWSSQNEQDNRYTAMQAYMPVFEPSDPQEAKEMTVYAYQFSETYGTPVMLRTVTRVNHATGVVKFGEIHRSARRIVFEKRPDLLIYDSAGARRNRQALLKRFEKVQEAVEKVPFNRIELAYGTGQGVVASSAAYNYVLEALNILGERGHVSVMKLGTTYPLPKNLLTRFLTSVERVLVVEEVEPVTEMMLKSLAYDAGVDVVIHGKDLLPRAGELTPRVVLEVLAKFLDVSPPVSFQAADRAHSFSETMPPPRPPTLCPGCPHRATYYSVATVSKRLNKNPKLYGLEKLYGENTETIFPGDIGCYGLAYLQPFQTIDTIICMGAGLGFANGLAKLVRQPIVVSVGDSTFFHAAIPALVNAVRNRSRLVVLVLDNDVTAMTGEQPHPGSSWDKKSSFKQVLIEDVARGCGVEFVRVVDPGDFQQAQKTLVEALKHDGPAVVVFRRPCELLRVREIVRGGEVITPYTVVPEKCTGCMVCINQFACPAIYRVGKKAAIDPAVCTGCGDCAKICIPNAIVRVG